MGRPATISRIVDVVRVNTSMSVGDMERIFVSLPLCRIPWEKPTVSAATNSGISLQYEVSNRA